MIFYFQILNLTSVILDDNMYACDSSIDNVLLRLNSDIPRVMDWFRSNEMVVNPDKFPWY